MSPTLTELRARAQRLTQITAAAILSGFKSEQSLKYTTMVAARKLAGAYWKWEVEIALRASASEQSAFKFVLEFVIRIKRTQKGHRFPATPASEFQRLHAGTNFDSRRPIKQLIAQPSNLHPCSVRGLHGTGPYSIQLTLGLHLSRCQGSMTKLRDG